MRSSGHSASAGAVDAPHQHIKRSPSGEVSNIDELDIGEILLLRSGWAYTYVDLPNGRRQILGLIFAGDEISLFWKRAASLGVRVFAVTQVEWWKGPSQGSGVSQTELTERQEAIQSRLMLSLARNGRMSALQSLADALVEVVDRLGLSDLEVTGGFTFPYSQETIADLLGLSSVHTSRTFKALASTVGLTRPSRLKIALRDMDSLRQLAACAS